MLSNSLSVGGVGAQPPQNAKTTSSTQPSPEPTPVPTVIVDNDSDTERQSAVETQSQEPSKQSNEGTNPELKIETTSASPDTASENVDDDESLKVGGSGGGANLQPQTPKTPQRDVSTLTLRGLISNQDVPQPEQDEEIHVDITDEGIAQARTDFFTSLTDGVGAELRKAAAGQMRAKKGGAKKKGAKGGKSKLSAGGSGSGSPKKTLTKSKSSTASMGFLEKSPKKKGKRLNLPYLPPSGSGHAPATDDMTRTAQLLTGWGDPEAIDKKDENGCSAVHVAAAKGKEEVLSFLIGKRADVNLRDNAGKTPLFYACSLGQRNAAAILLTNKADLSLSNDYGNTPLHAAVRNGHFGIVELLILNGCDPDQENNAGESCYDRAKTPEIRRFVKVCASRRQKEVEKWNAKLEAGQVEGEPNRPPMHATVWDAKEQKQFEERMKKFLKTTQSGRSSAMLSR
eukprot:GCRY01002431.1.p1 GENE.GCRY01002431.1~~GCRY01002431.1.p1  ORF type:complete len:456 (+),score=115.80 GCRY01002431.1:115-1482(+)